MSTLRIKDAPLLPDVDGSEKIPTGGKGDFSVTLDQVKTFARGSLPQQLEDHVNSTSNPHQVTKDQVGLGNADNTSDIDKPISTATQEALDLKANTLYVDNALNLKANIEDVNSALTLKADKTYVDTQDNLKLDKSEKGVSGGLATLDDSGKVPRTELPDFVDLSTTIPTYNTTDDGVDTVVGVADGAYFNVRSSSNDSYADEYQNMGGSAVATGKSYPSGSYVETIAEYTALPFKQGKTYGLNEHVQLESGDIVRNTVQNNTANPNTDMTGWEFSGSKVIETVADLTSIQTPKNGQTVYVKGYKKPTNLALVNPYEGGGYFTYDNTQSTINNTGTIINGWIRVFDGDIDISWFGAEQGKDASPYIEKALLIKKSIVIRGNYTLETICGIPVQDNYADNVIVIRGENQATLTVNCSTGAVFTSATAKLNPDSLSNLFTAKIDISGINFIGTTVANSVIFNGDRLYNMDIHHNNFKGNVTIVKAYLKRESGRQYTQSVSIKSNHLANVYRVIETDKSYNFDFSYNMCEACQGGMYIGVDAPWDPNTISLTINRNLWEGGGMLLKTNGGMIAGSVSKNYFESNISHDAAIEKCLISIGRSGSGAGYSSGLVFESNLFSGNTSIPDFIDVRFQGQSTESSDSSKLSITKSPIFIGNWSNSYRLTNLESAQLIANRCANRQLMKNAYSSQEGRVSYFSGYFDKTISSILTVKTLSLFKINTTPCLSSGAASTNFRTTFDINLFFKTSGGVNTASASFKLDVFVYAPFGAGTPPKAGLKAVMYNFVQSGVSDVIITGDTMKSVITTPVVSVVDNNDGTYSITLSDFTNASSPNWGAITSVRVEYTAQGSLISSAEGVYSTFNLLDIS